MVRQAIASEHYALGANESDPCPGAPSAIPATAIRISAQRENSTQYPIGGGFKASGFLDLKNLTVGRIRLRDMILGNGFDFFVV